MLHVLVTLPSITPCIMVLGRMLVLLYCGSPSSSCTATCVVPCFLLLTSVANSLSCSRVCSCLDLDVPAMPGGRENCAVCLKFGQSPKL
jgi:hypothetical protein